LIQGTNEVQTLSRPRSQLWVVAAPESTRDLCRNTNNLFNQNFYKWRFSVTLSVYLRDDHAFLLSSIDVYRSRVSTGYVKLINVLVSTPRLQWCFQQHIKHMSRTRCVLRDFRKTWATCLIDRSLNLFSIRLFKCNVHGDRTRSTPYSSLLNSATARETKGRALKFLQVPPWLLYVQVKSKFEISVQPDQRIQLESWPLYTFWRSSPWPYLVLPGFLNDLIWISETLFHDMIILLSMIWSYFLSYSCHASFHNLVMFLSMTLSCFFP